MIQLKNETSKFKEYKIKKSDESKLQITRLPDPPRFTSWRAAGARFSALATLRAVSERINTDSFEQSFFDLLSSMTEDVTRLFEKFANKDRDSILDSILERLSPGACYFVSFGCAGVTVAVGGLGVEFLLAGKFLHAVFLTVFSIYLFQESQTVFNRVEFNDECECLLKNFELKLNITFNRGRLSYEEFLKSGIWIDQVLQQLASKCGIPQREIERMSRQANGFWRTKLQF